MYHLTRFFFTIFYCKSFNNAGFGLFTLQGRSLWPSAPRMTKRWKREHLSTCRGRHKTGPCTMIIFYKWSSENRFFSTKSSLGWENRNYGLF